MNWNGILIFSKLIFRTGKKIKWHLIFQKIRTNQQGDWGQWKRKNFVWKMYWNFPLNLRVLPAEGNALILWFSVPAKSECKMSSDFWWKTFFFIRNVMAFCTHFLKVLKIRKWGHYLLQVIPSDLEGNFSTFFIRSFFPFNALGMPSFNNSVCYVYLEQSFAKKHYGSYLLLLWYAYKY